MSSNDFPAHPRSASNSVRVFRSTGTDDPSAASTANGETHAEARDGMNLSGLSNHELDLVIAKLEARVLQRRNKIRRIEALSEELGLSTRQQDWLALLNRPSPEPSQSIVVAERDCDHAQIQAESAAPQNGEPVPTSETRPTPDSVVTDDGSAISFSNLQAEPETVLQSQRLLRSHKRSHGQLARYADRHEGGEAEEIPEFYGQRSEVDENEGLRQGNSSLDLIEGVAKRTAWSVVLETHPEEIASKFRAGERPTNKQVSSMVGLSKSRQHQRNSRLNSYVSLICLPSTLW